MSPPSCLSILPVGVVGDENDPSFAVLESSVTLRTRFPPPRLAKSRPFPPNAPPDADASSSSSSSSSLNSRPFPSLSPSPGSILGSEESVELRWMFWRERLKASVPSSVWCVVVVEGEGEGDVGVLRWRRSSADVSAEDVVERESRPPSALRAAISNASNRLERESSLIDCHDD